MSVQVKTILDVDIVNKSSTYNQHSVGLSTAISTNLSGISGKLNLIGSGKTNTGTPVSYTKSYTDVNGRTVTNSDMALAGSVTVSNNYTLSAESWVTAPSGLYNHKYTEEKSWSMPKRGTKYDKIISLKEKDKKTEVSIISEFSVTNSQGTKATAKWGAKFPVEIKGSMYDDTFNRVK